ncbi:cytochrome P450 [Desarmillaria tabescens]|uniref:Cytochrome P450 n=1 Tax=Armillaria tabescens TaxID=1929756 RepID=A0AA39N2Z2_ARMTA|nr:cytochrome P450 [Desarmillaria tabescens]KAK0455285.1 cytochrome P450 [Desarmillaria tabescens]
MVGLLYELSRHPEDQARVCEEIATAKAGAFTSAEDDHLPLAEPIITSDGKAFAQVPISKGQIIFASMYIYNRLASIWDDYAAEWNPRRFLEDRGIKQESLGVYANLYDLFCHGSPLILPFDRMTLNAGIRGCIRWRFAVMELQPVITELLSNFEFSIPKGAPDLQHDPAGVLLLPIVPGKAQEGPQIPLLVTPPKK